MKVWLPSKAPSLLMFSRAVKEISFSSGVVYLFIGVLLSGKVRHIKAYNNLTPFYILPYIREKSMKYGKCSCEKVEKKREKNR